MSFSKAWNLLSVRHRNLSLLLITYFFINLINLSLLPVFNDESIYLDWAWSHTHMPGHLYDALLDAKQPLMVWIFAIFENFSSDPLWAGRFAAVVIGSISLVGIYMLGKSLFNQRIALISGFLYSITPIFVFYNRQALMEAGVACVGIWSFYFLLKLIQNPSNKNGLFLGLILGLGFLIKSSSLLFLIPTIFILSYFLLKENKKPLLKASVYAAVTFFCVNLILFINPIFWQTFSMNSRYSHTPAEFFTFPIGTWLRHFIGFAEISFVFLTPLTFIASIVGIFILWKNKLKNHILFLLFYLSTLFLEVFSVKSQSQRYLVAFLPFLILPASFIFNSLWSGNIIKRFIVILSFLIPFILTLFLISNPEQYILKLAKISSYSDTGYIYGQTSGYGVRETIDYIDQNSAHSSPNFIFIGLNIGNPESAVDVYSAMSKNLYTFHIDSRFFPGIEKFECLTSEYPTFFVTRDNQLLGMEHYFSLVNSYKHPFDKYAVNIYSLKKHCEGNTASLSDFYKPALNKLMEIRYGANSYTRLQLESQQLIAP